MKITTGTTLRDFSAWSGATGTKEKILDEHKEDEFESMIDELYPDGMTATELNDFLWFNEDFIYEHLGIDSEELDTESTDAS